MADNSRKTPLSRSLEAFAEKKIADAVQLLGQALPCSVLSVDGAIVTVKFEVDAAPFTLPKVTIPIAGSEYYRIPVQPGDAGVVFPADARLGGVSGLAPNLVPKLDKPANLSALVFFPIGNANWQPEDPDVAVIYGPSGATIKTKDGAVFLKVTASGIAIQGDVSIDGSLSVTGGVDVDGVLNATDGGVVTGDLTVSGNTSFGGGSKKVVLDGDPVTGGFVHASSTTIKAT